MSAEQEIAPSQEEALLHSELQEPPQDWQLNNLILEIADAISDEEFKKMKFLFTGEGGFGRGQLEQMATAFEFFDRMRMRGMLSRDNLTYLQQCLRALRRMDLVQKAVDYARTVGNVIYFYPASAEPINGYRNIKIHVDGKDFSNCSAAFIQSLRTKLSRVLMLPPADILIAGVEPSSSLLITIMIPEDYADMMERMLQRKDEFPELQEIGIDCIMIGDQTFNITGVGDLEIVETAQQAKLVSVYKQLQDKTTQLENAENETVRLQSELKNAKESIWRLERIEKCLKEIKGACTGAGENEKKVDDVSSKIEIAVMEFKCLLENVDEKGCNKALVKQLLDMNSMIVASCTSNFFAQLQESMAQELKHLKSQKVLLEFELFKYKCFTTDDIDKLILECFQNLLRSLSVEEQHQIVLKEEYIEVLREISRSIRPGERHKLAKEYIGEKEDDIKQIYDKDGTMLLAAMIYRKIETSKALIDCDVFVKECLESVGRSELQEKYEKLKGKLHRKQNSFRGEVGGTPPPPKSSSHQKKKGVQGTYLSSEMNRTINTMAGQIQSMHDIMQSAVSSHNKAGSWKKPPFQTEIPTDVFKRNLFSSEKSSP